MAAKLKRTIRLPERFRYIQFTDVDKPFATGDCRMDRYTLRDYYGSSLLPNHIVIVYDIDDSVGGVTDLIVEKDYILIDMLGRSNLVAKSGVGSKLVTLAENIARQLGIKEVRLESLDTVVGWYNQKMMYGEYRQPYQDPEFGTLTPKRKLLL